MQCGFLDYILEKKEDSGKTGNPSKQQLIVLYQC